MKYLYYAALAGVLGNIAGLTVGYFIFPTVIWNAYTMMYTMPPIIIEFNIPYAVISSAAALICTLVSTFAAVYAELASTPAALMRPKAPKAGKRVIFERIGPLWRRLSFTKKVTLRNLMPVSYTHLDVYKRQTFGFRRITIPLWISKTPRPPLKR